MACAAATGYCKGMGCGVLVMGLINVAAEMGRTCGAIGCDPNCGVCCGE